MNPRPCNDNRSSWAKTNNNGMWNEINQKTKIKQAKHNKYDASQEC